MSSFVDSEIICYTTDIVNFHELDQSTEQFLSLESRKYNNLFLYIQSAFEAMIFTLPAMQSICPPIPFTIQLTKPPPFLVTPKPSQKYSIYTHATCWIFHA